MEYLAQTPLKTETLEGEEDVRSQREHRVALEQGCPEQVRPATRLRCRMQLHLKANEER